MQVNDAANEEAVCAVCSVVCMYVCIYMYWQLLMMYGGEGKKQASKVYDAIDAPSLAFLRGAAARFPQETWYYVCNNNNSKDKVSMMFLLDGERGGAFIIEAWEGK